MLLFNPQAHVADHLAREAKGVDYLVLCECVLKALILRLRSSCGLLKAVSVCSRPSYCDPGP